MGNKLNPDGARIRILRIQRGWTQEQLAEIAGVSSRTVQRTESANCASFETVRAIAGAFEKDFGQLLKSEYPDVSVPEPQIHISIPADIEQNLVNLPKPSTRRVWVMASLSVSAMIIGLAAGLIVKSRSEMDPKFLPSPRSSSVPETSCKPVQPVITLNRKEGLVKKTPSTIAQASVPKPEHEPDEILLDSSRADQPAGSTVAADPAFQDSIQYSQDSGSLDLPLMSQDLLSELIISEAPLASSPQVPSGNRMADQQDLGAVRQAVDLATKKTGSAVSKFRTSLKRVF
jgi:transcriptional regulator with XRE-family HTH domain